MALFGEVLIKNCSKKHSIFLFLEDSKNGKRGENQTGDFVCEDLPKETGNQISSFWQEQYIDLKINVVKTFEQVREHPEQGIDVTCMEKCPFNLLRNKEF